MITAIITATQMYKEYDFEKQGIQHNLDTYQKIFGNSVATALWNLDDGQLNATLAGASALKDIAGILLEDVDGKTLFQSGLAPEHFTSEMTHYIDTHDLFYETFDVKFRDKQIGHLYVFSSGAIVFSKVKYNFIFIVVYAIIKSIILWLLFLWAFNRFLVRALDEFVSKMESTDFDSLTELEASDKTISTFNSRELLRLDSVFQQLKSRILRSKKTLHDLNANLESTVEKRTKLLSRQQNLLEAMSAQGRIGAWEYDVDTDTMYWSEMARNIFHVNDDFIPSRNNTLAFFNATYQKRMEEVERNAFLHGEPWAIELPMTAENGEEIWVSVTGDVERINNQTVRLFGSFQDINARVMANLELTSAKEKAEATDKTKSEFLASMSHEIRTPMNGLVGMIHVLLKTELDDSQRVQAKLSLSSAESLLAILNDILDISKIEAGRFELEQIDFDIHELLEEQHKFWNAKSHAKELSFELDLAGLEHNLVNGDPNRVKQIVSNLVNNAIKFTPAGEIKVSAKSEFKDGQYLVFLDVADTGIGIEANKLDAIFDSFTQADFSTTRQYGGTGLGLTIVQELVNMMDGQISVTSTIGQGSCFSCRLTLGKSSSINTMTNRVLKPQKTARIENEDFTSMGIRILLVEDNLVNQIVAQTMLSQIGLECDIVENGRLALQTLRASSNTAPYSLILMDCQMPEMDGYEATAKIRQGDVGERYLNIPIIAMTANAMVGDREKCLKSGMDDYLSKPISPDTLEQKLKLWSISPGN